MSKQVWTDDMVAFVADAYKKHSIEELTLRVNERFNKSFSVKAVRSMTRRYRLRCWRNRGQLNSGRLRIFTRDQAEFMRANYGPLGRKELQAATNAKFGTSFTLRQVVSYLKNNSINSGRSGRFEKGNVPPNAGTKGMGIMKANSGSFKPGLVPKNRKPVGTVIIESKDGYQVVKLAEGRWVFLHRVVWEEHNGPVPNGFAVSFLDGNKLNCDISNLELISRGELAVRNKMRMHDAPAELKPAANTLVKLRIATASARRRLKKQKAA